MEQRWRRNAKTGQGHWTLPRTKGVLSISGANLVFEFLGCALGILEEEMRMIPALSPAS